MNPDTKSQSFSKKRVYIFDRRGKLSDEEARESFIYFKKRHTELTHRTPFNYIEEDDLNV